MGIRLPGAPARQESQTWGQGTLDLLSRDFLDLVAVRPPIQDEFEKLPISKQRKYQLRMRRDRRCTKCGAPAATATYCVKHLVQARERMRRATGARRRYYSRPSYAVNRGG